MIFYSTMWGHSKKILWANQEEGPHQNLTMLASWSQTSKTPELWEINFCCLSHSVYGIMLQKPKLTQKHKHYISCSFVIPPLPLSHLLIPGNHWSTFLHYRLGCTFWDFSVNHWWLTFLCIAFFTWYKIPMWIQCGIHIVPHIKTPSLFIAKHYPTIWIYHSWFIYSPTNKDISVILPETTANKAIISVYT